MSEPLARKFSRIGDRLAADMFENQRGEYPVNDVEHLEGDAMRKTVSRAKAYRPG